MARYIFDTDVLTLAQRGQSAVTQRVLAADPSDLAITVISIEEQLTGWYSLLRQSKDSARRARVYERLAETVGYLGRWSILPYSEAALERGARLRVLKLNVRKMDLAIAAIVLEHGGVLVTRNMRDFGRIPQLVLEDWSLSVP